MSEYQSQHEKNREGDAYRRLNPVSVAVGRYCKLVTTGGRGVRRTRLERGIEGEKSDIVQIGGWCGTRSNESRSTEKLELTGFASAGSRPACRDH